MERARICFVGAGNLATHLSLAFSEHADVVQVYSRTEASAKMLADRLHCAYTTDIQALVNDADLYVCALKDSVLEEVLSQGDFKGKLVIHTAGSMPMSVFAAHAKRYGVIYPMQSFSKSKPVDFKKIPVFVEGSDAETLAYLHGLAEMVSDKVYDADTEVRGKLHIAAVFASNFSNHMYALAYELLKGSELPFEVLLPLIDETAQKVHSLAPKAAQTGPAVRYDTNVINKHLGMLKGDDALLEIYKLISKDIHERG